MDICPEFLASSWGREFVAGGFGGTAGVITGYPLDTLRILQQQYGQNGPALGILRRVIAAEGPAAVYRGMTAPFASVTFQWGICFSFGKLHRRGCHMHGSDHVEANIRFGGTKSQYLISEAKESKDM